MGLYLERYIESTEKSQQGHLEMAPIELFVAISDGLKNDNDGS